MQPREISNANYHWSCIKKRRQINVAWSAFNASQHPSSMDDSKIMGQTFEFKATQREEKGITMILS